MDRRRAEILVSGRVQGVWFRASTQKRARELGVAGWVRNLPNGRVEAIAEGPEDAVDALITWCHEGPEYAAVSAVDVSWGEPEGLSGFEIRR